MYGANWCGDTQRAKKFLEENNIEYTFLDVEDEEKGEEYSTIVMDLNEGKRIVPTFIIDDIQHTNPKNNTLSEVLEIKNTSSSSNDPEVCIPNFE